MGAGKGFQLLEVIEINQLVNEIFYLFLSDRKSHCDFENRVFRANETLEGIIEFILLKQTPC